MLAAISSFASVAFEYENNRCDVEENVKCRSVFGFGVDIMSSPSSSSSSSSSPTKTEAEALVDSSAVWVFGYGSLCWNPGFTFQQSMIGYVKGFSRKFWQGSTSHRGTVTQPGRVATLIEDDKALVWGRAFLVTEDSAAYHYLQKRECSNGGYLQEIVSFYPNGDESSTPIEAVTFIAYSDNHLWLGDAPLMDISWQIVNSKGMAGYNAEYVLKLADFMRRNVPQETDVELFTLEVLILDRIQKQKLCLTEMMNGGCAASAELEARIEAAESSSSSSQPHPRTAPASNEFANRVPDKKLRCVNI
ncbi:putative glutathione-specific gamma-glutamylcyclotransferase 2 isoform X2 [Planococcus citri]|uniref:putative glutathione-specific gamma-glutamylcyclotransferase 2 isoform X2 n=1 Tax=Planococcus citri TaxID=170843 RepID=UPI0031F81A54